MTGTPEVVSQGAIEQAIAFLEGTGQYRVLRKLTDKVAYYIKDSRLLKLAVILDLVTTRLNPISDEVIKLCVVPFSYSEDGYIFDVYPAFSGMQQPSKSIHPEVVK